MKKTLGLTAVFLLATIIAFSQDNPFSTKWDGGFKVENADKSLKFKFGGRIMWDNAFFFQDDSLEAKFGKLNNGTEFRRVRFFNSGTIYDNVNYKLQIEFAGGGITFKDVYITLKGLPGVGNLRVGHFKEPFRLEALTSSRHFTFMERAFGIDFMPERNTGFMLFNNFMNKRLFWQGGFFRRSDGAGNDKMADDGYALTSRLSGLPIKNQDGSRFILVGAAFSYRKPESRTYKIASRPEAHLGNKYVSTGTIADISEVSLFNVEALIVHGPLALQGEFIQSNITTRGDMPGKNSFNSYYGEVSYFITGEHKKYKNSNDVLGRVKPKNNWGGKSKGAGAWQVALRFSAIDLNSGNIETTGIPGGQQSDVTAAINWHLNPATRIMLNYVLAQVEGVGDASIVQMRFQLDF